MRIASLIGAVLLSVSSLQASAQEVGVADLQDFTLENAQDLADLCDADPGSAIYAEAEDRLQRAGSMTRSGDWFTVQLASDDDGITVPDLVQDLVGLGVRVHAVEPARISLEERLLSVLRHEETAPAEAAR